MESDWANQAVHDRERLMSPDPASRSHATVRVVGWSPGAKCVLTVILLRKEGPASGAWWGVNAWEANERDRREYWERREG